LNRKPSSTTSDKKPETLLTNRRCTPMKTLLIPPLAKEEDERIL